ncbi:hypothetical protein RSAG8_01903, partial [Rhizoctonia solani AG-8 WAC10335]
MAIPRYIQGDHQLASPVTSFARLKEGDFLSEKGIDPYEGGVLFHVSFHCFCWVHVFMT